jgi:uncharacterized protein YaaQ
VKLTLTVVRDEDANSVVDALISHGFSVTRLPSTGGFLRAGNTLLLVGLEDDQLEPMMEVIQGHTRLRVQPPASRVPEGTQVSRAVVFVMGLEELRRL